MSGTRTCAVRATSADAIPARTDYEEFLATGAHNPALSTFRDIADGSDDPRTDPA